MKPPVLPFAFALLAFGLAGMVGRGEAGIGEPSEPLTRGVQAPAGSTPALPATLPPMYAVAADGTRFLVPDPASMLDLARTDFAAVYVTEGQLAAAFVGAGMPQSEARRLARACVVCEAPYYDLIVTNGVRVDPSLGAQLRDTGADGGNSYGPCSIHRPTWGHLFDAHDPETLEGTATIAKEAHDTAIRMGRDPLWAWACAR